MIVDAGGSIGSIERCQDRAHQDTNPGSASTAAKLIMDRALPALKPPDRAAALPVAGGLSEAGRSVLAALNEGKPTLEQGARLMGDRQSLSIVRCRRSPCAVAAEPEPRF